MLEIIEEYQIEEGSDFERLMLDDFAIFVVTTMTTNVLFCQIHNFSVDFKSVILTEHPDILLAQRHFLIIIKVLVGLYCLRLLKVNELKMYTIDRAATNFLPAVLNLGCA